MVFDVETDSTRNKLQREIINTTLERYNKEVPNPAVAYAQNGGLAGLDGGGGGGSVIASSLETDYLDFGTQNGLQALNIFLLAGDKKYIRRITLANNNPLAFAISTENFVIDRITELYVIFVQDDTGGRQLALPSAAVYHNAHLLNFNLDKTAGAETTFRFSTTDAGVTWHIELVGLSAAAAGVSTIADATDTQIASPQNNQILTYDDGLSKWLPKNIAQIISLEPNEYGDIDVQEFLTNLPSTVWENITGLADAIENIGNDLWDAIGDVGMLVQEYLEGLSRTTWEEFTNFGDAVIDIGNGIWQTAEGVLEDIENWYTTTDNPAIVWIRDTLDGPIRTAITTASDFVTQFTADPYGTLTDLGKGIQDQVTAWWNSIDIEPINTIRTVLNSDAVRTAFGTAVTFFEGLGDGIADAIEDAGEFFGDPAAIPEKVIEYLLGTSSRAARFVTRLFNSGTLVVDNILRDLFGSGVEDVSSWLQGRKTDIITALGDAGTWLNSFVGDTGDKISEVSSWFELQWNGDNGIRNTITSNFNTISTLLRDILTGATDALSNLGQEFLSFIGLSSTNTLIPPAYGDTGIGLPLIYPEHEYGTVGASNISTILDLDLSQENSHVHRITAAGTITINFIGLPKAGMREFIQIEITQDDVGGHQITFNANGDPNLVQTDVDISLDPNATTTITGYVRHDSATLANFASREEPTQREEDTGGGIGNLGEWATLPASSAIDVAGNQINKIGALQFQEIAGSASSVISRHTGIDLRAGDEKTIRLLSSNVEILAEFDEDYIDLKNKTLRNLNLGNIASLIIDNSVSINKLASPASSVNHVLLSGGDNPNYWGQLNNIIGTLDGSKLLDKSVPVEKLEDLPLGVVTATDNTGLLVGTSVQLNRLNVALHDYPAPNINSPTVNDRLNDLESDSSSISSLADIDDVTISRPVASNSFIQYDSDNDRWINSQINFSEISGELPYSKIEVGELDQIVTRDEDGRVVKNSFLSASLVRAALFGYNQTDSIENRLSSLESDDNITTLAALDDTSIAIPASMEFLKYDDSTSKWVNGPINPDNIPVIPVTKLEKPPSNFANRALLAAGDNNNHFWGLLQAISGELPYSKIEVGELDQIVTRDEDGRVVKNSFLSASLVRAALFGYNQTDSIENRLSSLESGGGGGGSTFDPISITSNLLPADDRGVQLGTAMTRFSSAYLWNLEGYAGADLRGVVHVGRDGGDGSIPGFVGIHGPTNFYNNRIANIGYETISRLSELSESSLDENNDYLAILDDSDGRGEIKKIRASAFTGGGSSSGSSFDPGNITDNLEPRSNRGVHLGASNKRFNEGHIHDLTVYDNLTVNDGITAQGVIHSTAQITTAGFITAQTNLNVFGNINHDGARIGFRRAEPQLGTTWNLGPGLDIDERTVIAPSSQSASFTSFTLWQLLNAFNTLVSDLQLQGILL